LASDHQGEFIGSDVCEGICELEFMFKDNFFWEALPSAERFCFIAGLVPHTDVTIEETDIF
jgi:hypothetical protein